MNREENETQKFHCYVLDKMVEGEPAGYLHNGDAVSQEGLNSCFNCESCSELFTEGEKYTARNDKFYCSSCYDNLRQIDYRDYRNSSSLRQSEAGDIVKSTRPFGIELEVSYSHSKEGEAGEMTKVISKHIGVTSDGSVSGLGVELQTPPASGKKAEELINGLCAALTEYEAKVNNSCGYHIHIDVKDIDSFNYDSDKLTRVKDLWLFYIAFEDVLLSFLPPSRRTNTYCKLLRTHYHFEEVYEADSMERLERIWYRARNKNDLASAKSDHKHDSRYRGINMHTLFAERHIEIRFHGGTMNRRKVLEWANLHTAIVDRALSKGFDGHYLKSYLSQIDLVKKTDDFFKIVKLDSKSEDFFRARQIKFLEESLKTNKSSHDRNTVIAPNIVREAVDGIISEGEN